MKHLFFVLKTLSFSFLFLGFFIFGLAVYFFSEEKKIENRIYPNVFIDNINFGKKTVKEAKDYFQKKNHDLKKIKIVFIYDKKEIATFSAETIELRYDEAVINQAFLIGRTPLILSRFYQKIGTILNLSHYYFSSTLTFNPQPIESYLEYLGEKYNKQAINALFEVKEGKVIGFRKEKDGLMIKKEEALLNFENVVKTLKSEPKTTIRIKVNEKIIKPEITLSSINNFGIVEKIGEGKSDYTGSSFERIHNIKLASLKFHGILIPKNEIFSFNKTMGEVSVATGYKQAYIIKNGRTVLGDGGGICQVSTTLFRAALNAGLPIIERVAHAYRVSYYENDGPPGFDATVFAPSTDLKFKNNTPAYILIQTFINEEKNLLTFFFYGKKDGRKIEISQPIVWDVVPPPPPIYQEDPTLKKGVIKQIDWPSWGAKAKFHYRVEKEGKAIIEEDIFSSYRPWQAVFLVGIGE